MDLAQGFEDLLSIRDGVIEIIDAKNVRINIHNGATLTINITNSSLNSESSRSRRKVADQIARIAYERYTNRQKLEVVYVVFSAHERKFAVVDINSTVETFHYSPKEIAGLTVSNSIETPRRLNKALRLAVTARSNPNSSACMKRLRS